MSNLTPHVGQRAVPPAIPDDLRIATNGVHFIVQRRERRGIWPFRRTVWTCITVAKATQRDAERDLDVIRKQAGGWRPVSPTP